VVGECFDECWVVVLVGVVECCFGDCVDCEDVVVVDLYVGEVEVFGVLVEWDVGLVVVGFVDCLLVVLVEEDYGCVLYGGEDECFVDVILGCCIVVEVGDDGGVVVGFIVVDGVVVLDVYCVVGGV